MSVTTIRLDFVTFRDALERELETQRAALESVPPFYRPRVEASIAEGEKALESAARELERFDTVSGRSVADAQASYKQAVQEKRAADESLGALGTSATDEEIAAALVRQQVAGIRVGAAEREQIRAIQDRNATLSTTKLRKLADAAARGRELAVTAAKRMANENEYGTPALFVVAPAELAGFHCATGPALDALAEALERELRYRYSGAEKALVAAAREETTPTDERALDAWRRMRRGAERLRHLAAHSEADAAAKGGAQALSQLTAKLMEASS